MAVIWKCVHSCKVFFKTKFCITVLPPISIYCWWKDCRREKTYNNSPVGNHTDYVFDNSFFAFQENNMKVYNCPYLCRNVHVSPNILCLRKEHYFVLGSVEEVVSAWNSASQPCPSMPSASRQSSGLQDQVGTFEVTWVESQQSTFLSLLLLPLN